MATLSWLGIIGLVLAGIFVGTFSGFFGLGGGVIIIPILTEVFKVEPHRALGTSLAVMIPTALVGALRHAHYGNTDLKIAIIMWCGSLLGAFLGATLVSQIPGGLVKKLLAIIIILLAIRMFFSKS
ncbi:sulfite exporter TauE/SafE family protein [bacterium]|nr:sulfite exporter TauE/SafE family protein [bacterium]